MSTSKSLDLPIVMTTHAQQRIAQRGVRRRELALLVLHGSDISAGKRCVRRFLTKAQLSDLRAQGYDRRTIEGASCLEAVLSSDDVLITCYKRKPKGSALAQGRTVHRSLSEQYESAIA